MSDQHGYGEKASLGDESRSVDSESAGRSHMDFFSEHPDDVAARGRALVDDKPLVQADVLTLEQSSVPEYINKIEKMEAINQLSETKLITLVNVIMEMDTESPSDDDDKDDSDDDEYCLVGLVSS